MPYKSKKTAMFKTKGIRRPTGLIRSIENVVRNMGPPRNVFTYGWGVLDVKNTGTNGSNNLLYSCTLLALAAAGLNAVPISATNVPTTPSYSATGTISATEG